MLGVHSSSTKSQMIGSTCVTRKLTVQVADLQGAAAHSVWSHGHSGFRGHLRDIQRCETPLLSRAEFLLSANSCTAKLGLLVSRHSYVTSKDIGIRQHGVAAAQLHHTSNMAVADCGGQSGLQPHQLCPLTAARLQVRPCMSSPDVAQYPCHAAKTV